MEPYGTGTEKTGYLFTLTCVLYRINNLLVQKIIDCAYALAGAYRLFWVFTLNLLNVFSCRHYICVIHLSDFDAAITITIRSADVTCTSEPSIMKKERRGIIIHLITPVSNTTNSRTIVKRQWKQTTPTLRFTTELTKRRFYICYYYFIIFK